MNEAHGMRLDHPIFTTPLRANLETRAIAMPEGYRSWEANLPATIDAWKVQDGKLGETVDYGLVSSPYGFEDTPDAEWISGGVNSKGPKSMALGRHGNWFLWGFAGDPRQMTESARQVFLNTLVWMKQFDGKAPIQASSVASPTGGNVVVGRTPSRDEAFVHVQHVRAWADDPRMMT